MTAEGMDLRYPGHGLWPLMLLMGFLVLYPGQIMSGDTTSRRWCDIIWTASPHAHRLEEHRVKYVYYSIMMVSLVWGLVAMTYFNPLQFGGEACVVDCRDLLDQAPPGRSPLVRRERIEAWKKKHRPLRFGDVVIFRSGYSGRHYRPLPEGRRIIGDPSAGTIAGVARPRLRR